MPPKQMLLSPEMEVFITPVTAILIHWPALRMGEIMEMQESAVQYTTWTASSSISSPELLVNYKQVCIEGSNLLDMDSPQGR